MFGKTKQDDEPQTASPALMAEVARLESLPLPQLAAEVMAKAFGPGGEADPDATVTVGGPNVNAGVTASAIATDFVTLGHLPKGDEVAAHNRLEQLVAEGLQVLEHAALVRVQMHTSMGELDYAITRAGRAALDRGAVEQTLAGA